MEHCKACLNALAFRVARVMADEMAKAGVHIGSESHNYRVEVGEQVTRVSFGFANGEPHEPEKPHDA